MELALPKTSTADLMTEAERLGTVINGSIGALLSIIGELDKREACGMRVLHLCRSG